MNLKSMPPRLASSLEEYLLWMAIVFVMGCQKPSTADVTTMRLKAQSFINGGNCTDATQFLDSCLNVVPKDAWLRYQKSLCMDMVTQYDEIQAQLAIALGNLPKDSCHLRLLILEHSGHANRYKENYRKAYADYRAAYLQEVDCLSDFRDDKSGNLINAAAMASMFDFDLADSISNVMIRRFPKEIDGFQMHASIRLIPGFFQIARLEYDTLLMQFLDDSIPEIGEVYYERGLASQGLLDFEAACADWKKALLLGADWAKPKLDSFCTGIK